MMIVLPVGRNGNDDEVCCRSRGGIGRLIGHEHGFVSVLSVSVDSSWLQGRDSKCKWKLMN
jgi:hypothetical protein